MARSKTVEIKADLGPRPDGERPLEFAVTEAMKARDLETILAPAKRNGSGGSGRDRSTSRRSRTRLSSKDVSFEIEKLKRVIADRDRQIANQKREENRTGRGRQVNEVENVTVLDPVAKRVVARVALAGFHTR